MRQLEKRGQKFKRLVANQPLDKAMLQEGPSKTSVAPGQLREIVHCGQVRFHVSERRPLRVDRRTHRYKSIRADHGIEEHVEAWEAFYIVLRTTSLAIDKARVRRQTRR